MKKAIFIVTILFVAVISTACINNIAVQELNSAAKTYMEQGDYASAIERLESSLELDKTVYETHYNLGVAYIDAKQYEKAIDALNNAVKINSKYANTYYTLAVAQEKYADSLIGSDEDVSLSADANAELAGETPKYDTYKNVSDEIKERMIQSYLTSISNYRKYVEIVNSSKKTEDINSHIVDMEKVLTHLGYTGSSF